MVPLLVFYLHVVGFALGFTKRWQEEGVSEGALVVVFMALIFFVGWSMTSFVVRLVLAPEGFGRWFDADAASLTLLTLLEGIFYYFYFRKEKPVPENTGGVSEAQN